MKVYEDDEIIIDWNESATFNVFSKPDYDTIDCFTVYDCTPEQAVEEAQNHIINT